MSSFWKLLVVATLVAGCGAASSDSAEDPSGIGGTGEWSEPRTLEGSGGRGEEGEGLEGSGIDQSDSPPPPPPGDPPAPDPVEEGAEAFQTGNAHMMQGNWEAARAAFQEAYDLSGNANALFNLAMSCERLDDAAGAREAYALLLESPDASPDLKQEAETRIQSLQEAAPE